MATQSRNLFQHLPPPAECFALFVASLELFPFGIAGLLDQSSFADGYGLPIDSTNTATPLIAAQQSNPASSAATALSDESLKTKKALVAAIAARNVQNGVLLFTFGLVLRDRRSLGVAVLAGLVATIADTAIVNAYGAKDKIAGHFVGVFNSLAIGGSLLYWGRHDPMW